jgi:hypothetical protein
MTKKNSLLPNMWTSLQIPLAAEAHPAGKSLLEVQTSEDRKVSDTRSGNSKISSFHGRSQSILE